MSSSMHAILAEMTEIQEIYRMESAAKGMFT